MERRRRPDDGSWNRPHYGGAHSNQPGDYYEDASPQYLRTGPHTDLPRGRTPGAWGGRVQDSSQQQYGPGGPQRRLPGALEAEHFHHGRLHSVEDYEDQAGLFSHGGDRPQPGLPPHRTSSEQRESYYGGPQPGLPPHRTTTNQHGGLQPGLPPHRTTTEPNESHYGGPQPGFPPHRTSAEQRESNHEGPQPGFPPHRTTAEQSEPHYEGPQSGFPPHRTTAEPGESHYGGPQPGFPPHRTTAEQRESNQGGPQHAIPPHRTATNQHGGPQPGFPPHRTTAELSESHFGGPQPGFPPHRTTTELSEPHYGGPQPGFPPHRTSAEQRDSNQGGPQHAIPPHRTATNQHGPQPGVPPHRTSNEQMAFQPGGPQSGVPPNLLTGEPRTSYHGGPKPGFSHMFSTEQHGGSPLDVPPRIASTEQITSRFGGPQSGIAPHMSSNEQRGSHRGGPQSGIDHTASTEHRGPQYEGPWPGIPPHMAGTERRTSHHGGPQSGIDHMASTEQHGGSQSDIRLHVASTEQKRSHHGGPQPGIPPHMTSYEQRASHHVDPRSGLPPHMTGIGLKAFSHGGPQSGILNMASTEQHGGPQSGIPCMTTDEHSLSQLGQHIPPGLAITEQRGFQRGGPLSDTPSGMPTVEQKVSQHGAPQPGVPYITDIEQRTSQHRGPQSGVSHMVSPGPRAPQYGGPSSDSLPRMASVEQRISQHESAQPGIPHMDSTEQRSFHHAGPQSDIPPHMASTKKETFQLGGPESDDFQYGPSQPRSIYYGGPQHEELQHKGAGQDAFRVEDSQQRAWNFQKSQPGEPGISSFGGSQLEGFNATSLNRPLPNDVFHHRVPPPSIIQPSSTQLPPGSAQSIQHPSNPLQSQYSFPPPPHGPPLNPATIPSFFHPPMDPVFGGPPKEGHQDVSHAQAPHLKNVLTHEPERLDNTAPFNLHRQGTHMLPEMRPGHPPDPYRTSEVTGMQNNPFFSKNSFQAGDANVFHQDVPDLLRGQHFSQQQHEKSMMNPNKQQEMLVCKEDPADKELFQRFLYNFLACRRNKLSPKPESVQSVSIPEARNVIYGALTLISQLSSLCQSLENNKEEGPSWNEDYEKAKDLKANLEKKIRALEKPGFIQCVKLKLDRIRKKRLRCRSRKEANEEEKEAAERAAEREAEIDTWRMKRVQEVEEKKKERELKAAADSVLGEVRRKQADAKKMLDMLKSLEKLRKLRKEAAARKGVSPPPSADETFKNHVTRLRSMVHKRVALYDAEERALRVILEGEQEEERQRDKDRRLKKQREKLLQKQRELDSILFGDDEPLPAFHPHQPFRQYHLQAEHSVVSLVQIRHEWDRFLAPPDHPDASGIPRGWALPMPPSSDIWATALKPAE